MKMLSERWSQVQEVLFPFLDQVLDEPLTDKLRQLVSILEVLRIEEHVRPWWRRMGRKPHDRRPIARAFVAKAVYNLPHTELLVEMLHNQPSLRRICGWQRRSEIPSVSTFSRAFAAFAGDHLGDRVHQALVAEHITGEDITQNIVLHVSRDSTEVEAREKPVRKAKEEPGAKEEAKEKRKRGRQRKDEQREPPPPTRLQRQMQQTPEQAIAELPIVCDVGAKLDTRYLAGWRVTFLLAQHRIGTQAPLCRERILVFRLQQPMVCVFQPNAEDGDAL